MGKLSIHDNFIRTIMSDKNIAKDYFKSYLPLFVKNRLDFDTLEQSPDTYISKELQKTMSDIVYTCLLKGTGDPVKVSLLIEHKSYIDKNTPIQIGSYIFSGLMKQVINKEKLAMIIPVLLYHGKDRWEYHTLSDLFVNMEPKWKSFLPNFNYIYNNLGEIPDAEIEILNNNFLMASILSLKHSFDKNWLEKNAIRLLLLLENTDRNLQQGFIVYLFTRSGIRASEIIDSLRELPLTLKDTVMSTLDSFVELGKKIGFEEGIEKGIERGKTDFVVNLLHNTDFTMDQIAKLANVSEDFVSRIKQSNEDK